MSDKNRQVARAIWSVAAAATLALAPLPAAAQSSQTLGGVFSNVGDNLWQPFLLLIVAIAYLVGFGLLTSGLVRLRDASGREGGTLGDGLGRLAGAAFLICLPDLMGAGLMTLYASGGAFSATGVAAGGTENCLSSAGAATPLTCVAKNFAVNVVPVAIKVIFGLFFLVGLAIVAHCVHVAATASSQGQRGLPKGWTPKLVLGIVVANIPQLMMAVSGTIGIGDMTVNSSGFNSGSSLLSYTGGSGAISVLASYADLIKWVFQILILFGVVAVARGISFLKAHADGGQQGGMGAGLTHIVGGVLLANSKFTVCVVVNTLFGFSAGTTMGFC